MQVIRREMLAPFKLNQLPRRADILVRPKPVKRRQHRASKAPLLFTAFFLSVSALSSASEKNLRDPQSDLLTTLQHRGFDFFWFEADPKTGLVKDRAGNRAGDNYTEASIASTGFALASLPVAVKHGWVTRERAQERALTTLKFARDNTAQTNGWFYHFIDRTTGERAWKCELSSIDSALFLGGVLLAGECFGGEVGEVANAIYRRVDFQWMLTDGGTKPNEKFLSHGWTPEGGFIKSRWLNYSEHLMLNLLAIGSPTHPIPAGCWEAWQRNVGEYKGFKTFACGPLFTYQYSQAFIDFRGKHDRQGFNYFDASIQATKANRQFCIDQSAKYKTYGSNVWGLSACDKPISGYEAYAAPPGKPIHDGTIAPWATVASLPFAPEETLAAVTHIYERFGDKLWGRYGFGNSFNLDRNWFAPDVIGIDLGAAILLIENARTGFVWEHFMRTQPIKEAMKKAGFSERN